MTEFNKKYTKGFVLFVVLLLFEVPLLLNYLLSRNVLRSTVAHVP